MSDEEENDKELSPREQAIQDALATPHPALTKKKNTLLRLEAMAAYIEGVDCSIDDVARLAEFRDHVKPRVMHQWASEDKWTDKRKKQLAKIKNKIAAAVGNSLTTNFTREFMDLHEIRTQAIKFITPDEDGKVVLRPRSWENVVKILFQANERLSYLQQLMQSDVIDETGNMLQSGKKDENPRGGAPLDPERARELAAALIAKDRDKLREELKIDITKSAEESKEADGNTPSNLPSDGESAGNSEE